MSSDARRIKIAFFRDLATRTEQEVAGLWAGAKLTALEKTNPGLFDGLIRDHNPIYFIARRVWFDNEDPKDPMLYPQFHRDQLCRALLDWELTERHNYAGMVLMAQRDSYKSTFAHGAYVHFRIWRAKYVEGRDLRYAIVHHSQDMIAEKVNLLKAKSIHSDFIRQVWNTDGLRFAADEDWDNNKGFNWPCKTKGIFKERSVSGFGMGSNRTGDHYDRVTFDDTVTDEHKESRRIREGAFSRYTSTLAMLDRRDGCHELIGTPYHAHDLYAKLEKAGDYLSINIPAGGKHANKPLTIGLRGMQKHLDAKLKIHKALGEEWFYWAQYQIERRHDSQIATDPAWIKRITQEEFDERCGETAIRVALVDPAWKGTKQSGEGDSAAIAMVALETVGVLTNIYILDGVHDNTLTAHDGIDTIFALMRKWGSSDVAPEEHGGYTFRGFLEEEANKRGIYLNIIELKTKNVGKKIRMVMFGKRAQGGGVYLVDSCNESFANAFLGQFEEFPQNDHDDALDAVAYSCDPAILEQYSAPFNHRAAFRDESTYPVTEQLTRYCTN